MDRDLRGLAPKLMQGIQMDYLLKVNIVRGQLDVVVQASLL